MGGTQLSMQSSRKLDARSKLCWLSLVFVLIQIPMALITILLNLYCVCAILLIKDLRRVEFILVATQTSIDLIVSGFVAFFYHRPRFWKYFFNMCSNFAFYEQMMKSSDASWESPKEIGKHII